MEAEFDAIDTNGGGMILFQEFTNWAFSKNFDLEDDIDSQADEDANLIIVKSELHNNLCCCH